MKELELTLKADIALDTLSPKSRNKALRVIDEIQHSFGSGHIVPGVRKLEHLKNHYVAKAGPTFRIIFEVTSDRIIIREVVDHDRLNRFLKPGY